MKGKAVLYASLALNVVLLVVLAVPRGADLNLAKAEAVSVNVGSLAATVSRGGGEQDAVWIADQVTGMMSVYQYDLSSQTDPVKLIATIDLRTGLQSRQLGPLMLLPSAISSNRAIVFAIDTNSQRSAIYYYDRSAGTVTGEQRIDLRQAFAQGMNTP